MKCCSPGSNPYLNKCIKCKTKKRTKVGKARRAGTSLRIVDFAPSSTPRTRARGNVTFARGTNFLTSGQRRAREFNAASRIQSTWRYNREFKGLRGAAASRIQRAWRSRPVRPAPRRYVVRTPSRGGPLPILVTPEQTIGRQRSPPSTGTTTPLRTIAQRRDEIRSRRESRRQERSATTLQRAYRRRLASTSAVDGHVRVPLTSARPVRDGRSDINIMPVPRRLAPNPLSLRARLAATGNYPMSHHINARRGRSVAASQATVPGYGAITQYDYRLRFGREPTVFRHPERSGAMEPHYINPDSGDTQNVTEST